MDAQTEILLVKEIFKELRNLLKEYSTERNFTMSNAQSFTFLSYVPNSLAIASDREIDNSELNALQNIAIAINVDTMVNLDLMEMLAFAPEPDNVMSNQEFNIRAGAELLFIAQNMDKYEKLFVQAVKTFLKFDKNPESDGSLSKSFVTMMDSLTKNNRSKNKEEETIKLNAIKKELGLV
ncbi:MAG: hypothetical protein KAI79_07855 [Bacteroidales bacterium]|nr:hypothetical protein [Bacteroidales bacterium]